MLSQNIKAPVVVSFVVRVDFCVDLLPKLQHGDQLVSEGLSFYFHHDAVFGVSSQV